MSDFPVLVPHHERPAWFWRVIFIGTPLALGLGTVGFRLHDKEPAGLGSWLDALYHSVQLFILHMPHMEGPVNGYLELGRWLAAGLFGFAAMIALYDILTTEFQHFRLRFASGHTVICGLGPKVMELARCFGEADKAGPVVIIAPPEEGHAPLHSADAVVIVGSPVDPANLVKARTQAAKRIIALCSDDHTNVQVAVEAGKLVHAKAPNPSEPLRCFVQLADVDLRASLHRTASFGDQRCQVRFFDLFDAAARRFLLQPVHLRADSPYKALDHGGVTESDRRFVHLVLLGFGRMGRTVAVRAAQLGHFANGKPIRISVIDREADRHKGMLLFRYPNFEKTCAIEFHKTEIETRQARDLLEEWCTTADSATSIAVCFDQDSLALEVALRLFPTLERFDTPVAVRMSRKSGFASLLEEGKVKPDLRFQLRGFGMLEDTCCGDVLEDSLNETLAQAIHENFRRRRIAEGRDPAEPSSRPWDELNDDFRDSNRQQADHLAIKLQGIGCVRAEHNDPRMITVNAFGDHEVEIMARMEHSRWNAERWLAGWMQGPRDASRRSSPYLVPWEELPPNIQEYDREAVRLIPALLDAIGEKVCRKEANS